MPQAAAILPSVMKFLPLVGTGLGFLANRSQASRANRVLDLQYQRANLSPEAIARGIQMFDRKLSPALEQNVGNSVQGAVAERGLAQAPGIFASIMAQALAPYQLQNRQQSINSYMNWLGLPFGTPVPNVQPFDMSGLMQKIMDTFKRPVAGGTSAGTVPIFSRPLPNSDDDWAGITPEAIPGLWPGWQTGGGN